MVSKIILSIAIFILIISALFASFIYIGGIPVGFKNKRILVKKNYCVTDAGCPRVTKTFYSRVKSEDACKNLGGQIQFGGIGVYVGCEAK